MSGAERQEAEPAYPALTEDIFLGGRLRLLQPAKGFRAGLDSVLLAAAIDEEAEGEAGPVVLDVGAGVGTAGLCVAARLTSALVTLLEVAPPLIELARRNVERNKLNDRVGVVAHDIAARGALPEGLAEGTFDVVIANPPYLERGRHRLPDGELAASAFGMETGGLVHWARFMARMAAPAGRMVMIHRAEALADVLAAMVGRFGGLTVLPLHPRVGEAAHRVIVLGRKGSRAPMSLRAGVVLHGDGNAFLPPIEAVLRKAAGLSDL